MRIISGLIIFGILLSYVPVVAMEECPEMDHSGEINLDCGSPFHCPFIFNHGIPEKFVLPLQGRMVLANHLSDLKVIPRPIFHPPETQEGKDIKGSEGYI